MVIGWWYTRVVHQDILLTHAGMRCHRSNAGMGLDQPIPAWDSIKQCRHGCVTDPMRMGVSLIQCQHGVTKNSCRHGVSDPIPAWMYRTHAGMGVLDSCRHGCCGYMPAWVLRVHAVMGIPSLIHGVNLGIPSLVKPSPSVKTVTFCHSGHFVTFC